MLDAGSRYLGAFYGRAVPCNVDYVPDLTRRWPISEHQSREITGGDVRRASSYGIYERGDEDPCRKQHGERRAVLMPPAPPPPCSLVLSHTRTPYSVRRAAMANLCDAYGEHCQGSLGFLYGEDLSDMPHTRRTTVASSTSLLSSTCF